MQNAEKIPEDIQDIVVHRRPACRIEMEVKALPTLVTSARKTAIKKVGKEVSFPGFRKGKAPEDVILKKYPGAVETEWHKAIADAAFAAAQMQKRIPVLNTGAPVTFDLKKHSPEETVLSFSFETEPTLPHIDPKELKLKPIKRAEVGDVQIDEAIRQVQYFYADWKNITGRGIQEGDTITIDLETMDDPPQKVFHHVRFEVSEGRMANWMKALVFGKTAGEVLEGLSEPDETLSEEEKQAFAPKKVRLTIHKVEKATLPPLDDDFAHKMGAKDPLQMRESIRKILEQNVNDKVRQEEREQVNDFLIETYQFELPLSLIETEKEHRKKQLLSNPEARSAYEALSSEERKKADEKLYLEASQAVRLFYLSRQIVRDAKIPVTQSEVQQEAVRSANASGNHLPPDQLPKELFALALSKVILAKAQDYILQESGEKTSPSV